VPGREGNLEWGSAPGSAWWTDGACHHCEPDGTESQNGALAVWLLAVSGFLTLLIILKPACRIFLANL
jgi:hypothetical protein